MIIDTLKWDRVEVECPEDSSLNSSYRNATVELNKASMSIVGNDKTNPCLKTGFYIRVNVVSLSLTGFVAKAEYGSSMEGKEIQYCNKPVTITGYF